MTHACIPLPWYLGKGNSFCDMSSLAAALAYTFKEFHISILKSSWWQRNLRKPFAQVALLSAFCERFAELWPWFRLPRGARGSISP